MPYSAGQCKHAALLRERGSLLGAAGRGRAWRGRARQGSAWQTHSGLRAVAVCSERPGKALQGVAKRGAAQSSG
jgi:hypothetical protein